MFFIVTHSWEKEAETEVNRTFVDLMRGAYYGKVGNPWPRLFNIWLDPKRPTAYALWESSTPDALADVLKELPDIETEFVHVRQLFPPHVDLYHVTKIETE